MKSKLIVAALAVAMAWTAGLIAEEATGTDAKCVVSGKAIKKAVSSDFEGGKVYFCCPGCVGPFNKDTAKFAAKARLQMVQTGQKKQVHCPISHKPFKSGTELVVGGVEVKFCCKNCKGKVEKMTPDEQVATCFAAGDCFEAVKK
jgi:YHS domain-containing protein